jgi:hypothetical protein
MYDAPDPPAPLTRAQRITGNIYFAILVLALIAVIVANAATAREPANNPEVWVAGVIVRNADGSFFTALPFQRSWLPDIGPFHSEKECLNFEAADYDFKGDLHEIDIDAAADHRTVEPVCSLEVD